MSGLLLPPGVTLNKRERKYKRLVVCGVELIPDDEKDENSDVFCDVLVTANIDLIRSKTDFGKIITAAYEIPEEERKGYYISDYDGNKRFVDINGEPFALCNLREGWQAMGSDMAAMVEGDQMVSSRMGVAYFCFHGVCDNPLLEDKILQGRIKMLFTRVP